MHHPTDRWLKALVHWSLRGVLLMSLWMMSWLGIGPAALAVPLAKQTPINLMVQLGNEAGELVFEPNELQFKAGKRYRLVLRNPSPQKHYFTAKDFADAVWSQKVDAGNVEIKGAIHELELRPNTEAEWVFVPVRAGRYDLRCTIPGHREAGMVGTIDITG